MWITCLALAFISALISYNLIIKIFPTDIIITNLSEHTWHVGVRHGFGLRLDYSNFVRPNETASFPGIGLIGYVVELRKNDTDKSYSWKDQPYIYWLLAAIFAIYLLPKWTSELKSDWFDELLGNRITNMIPLHFLERIPEWVQNWTQNWLQDLIQDWAQNVWQNFAAHWNLEWINNLFQIVNHIVISVVVIIVAFVSMLFRPAILQVLLFLMPGENNCEIQGGPPIHTVNGVAVTGIDENTKFTFQCVPISNYMSYETSLFDCVIIRKLF